MEFELNWEISQREDRRGSKTTPGNRPCRIVFASVLGHSGLIVSSLSCHMLASSTRFVVTVGTALATNVKRSV